MPQEAKGASKAGGILGSGGSGLFGHATCDYHQAHPIVYLQCCSIRAASGHVLPPSHT